MNKIRKVSLIGSFFFSSLLIFYTLYRIEKKEQSEWQQLQENLWQSNITGEFAIKTKQIVSNNTYEDKYLTDFIQDDKADAVLSLKKVIDKWTFRKLDDGFYQDKDSVYFHREMSDGGYIVKVSADAASFKIIGECYAKDKDNIYSNIPNLQTDGFDYDSFKTCFNCGCIAKDKNGLYYYGSDHKLDLKNPRLINIYHNDKQAFDYLEQQ